MGFFCLLPPQIHQEFQIQLCELTMENLLEQFALGKHTGLERPGRLMLLMEKEEEEAKRGPELEQSLIELEQLPHYATVPRSRMRKEKRRRGKDYVICTQRWEN